MSGCPIPLARPLNLHLKHSMWATSRPSSWSCSTCPQSLATMCWGCWFLLCALWIFWLVHSQPPQRGVNSIGRTVWIGLIPLNSRNMFLWIYWKWLIPGSPFFTCRLAFLNRLKWIARACKSTNRQPLHSAWRSRLLYGSWILWISFFRH